MRKKTINYILATTLLLLVAYFSLDVENLRKYKARTYQTAFDAGEFANQYWNENLPLSIAGAPEVTAVIKQLREDPDSAFKQSGRKLGISKTYYFMLRGTGKIHSVEDEYLTILISPSDTIRLATAFIFGNAVRDGSGQVDINQFVNMTDFNQVSVAINKLVKEKVISRLKKLARPGKQIDFAGVAELREDQTIPTSIAIIPVEAIISDGKTE